jgi:ADP-heptose:LPS heptosyltransferase
VDKLILKCDLSAGDIVMLTAAVRDLHLSYPNRFLTDVRTLCSDLWVENPYLTSIEDSDPTARIIDCQYPLINRCNTTPAHCLQGFIEFLNGELGLEIKLSACKGDLHLSAQERAWFSQVHELTKEATPFWILASGGKYDVTVKWWARERYQQVVDYFRGKILFVQVGQQGHHHPKLDEVVDLRGRTSLRMLVRLMHHAQGVLSPVTCLMHLAAAVEGKKGAPATRPCVVIAGGREPVHWEQYSGHQFIHTIGALSCCAHGGCWKDRAEPLHDGDQRDEPRHLCTDVVRSLPRCLDLITAKEVIHRIERYYEGGVLSYLSPPQWTAARSGISMTKRNAFDRLPLTSANARVACEQFIRSIPECATVFTGRGIVIAAGGCRYFTNAWVTINLLRQLGCRLPIQVWYLGPQELDQTMAELLRPLNVECVDAFEIRKKTPSRILGGWELKCYAVLNSSFEEVLFLDADNVPVRNPEYLFQASEYQKSGTIFWPDLGSFEKTRYVWELLGLKCPDGPEFESGQMLVNKSRCWRSLSLAMWLNENSDFFFRYLHGDKETFHLAFRKLGEPFTLVQIPVQALPGTMCQHDLQGRRLFQHRNTDKWNLFANNPVVPDFWLEKDCRHYLHLLQQKWLGRVQSSKRSFAAKTTARNSRQPTVVGGMISCRKRDGMREQTLKNLAATDWGDASIFVELDDGVGDDPLEGRARTALKLLGRFLADRNGDYLLFLEDDLKFNFHLRSNLSAWPLLRSRSITLAGLYNPGIMEDACDLGNRAYLVRPDHVYGSQALLLSRRAAQFAVDHWTEEEGVQDLKLSRLVGRMKRPIWYHSPSLVQPLGGESTWGGPLHSAADFDPDWQAG